MLGKSCRLAPGALGWCVAVWVLAASAPALGQAPESPAESANGEPASKEAAPAAAPKLGQLPKLKELIQPEIPDGTDFPSPEVVVILKLQVDPEGKIANAEVLQGVGEPFDSRALAAGKRFEFEPARLTTGEPVPVTITFRLRIQEPEPPPPPPVKMTARLIERGTRKPLVGVMVMAQIGAEVLTQGETDETGAVSLEIAESRFRLVAAPQDHERLDAPVEAQPGEQREELFYLMRRAPKSRYGTVIRGRKLRREVTQRVIPVEEIELLPGTSGDTLKVVQNLPGVARAPFGGGAVVLRGASPGDSRVLLEGQEIPLAYHFGGLRSVFTSRFLEGIEFIPGNFGPDFGRAIGGIIDVRVRDPATDMFRGQVDVNLYDSSVAFEGPLNEDWSFGAGFRRSYVDTVLPFVLPDDLPLSFDVAPRYYDYQFIGSWHPSKRHQMRFMYYGSRDKLSILFDEPAGSDPKIRGALTSNVLFHNIAASSNARLTPNLRQRISVQTGITGIQFELGPEFFFDLAVQRVSLRADWAWKASETLMVRGGIDSRFQRVQIALSAPSPPKEGDNPVPVSTLDNLSIDQKGTVFEPAVFSELRLTPMKGLMIAPSVRVDYYEAIDDYTVDPRLLFEVAVGDQTSVKAGVGYYQQQPQYDESAPEVGNPALNAARSLQMSMGVEQALAEEMLQVEVTGFYKNLDRLVLRNPEVFSNPEAPRYTNDGLGRIYGLEFLIKLRLDPNFFGWLAYTYQRSFRTDGPDADERLFDFDQPHILTLLGSYKIGAGWTAGLRFRFVSGNPDTPVDGAVYDTTSDTYVPRYGANNSDRLAPFVQLDARVDKTWTYDTWKLSAYLDVQNATNRGNQEGWRYNYDYTQRQPITGLPILPILGVKGEW